MSLKNRVSILWLPFCLFLSGCYDVDFRLSPEGAEAIFHTNGISINKGDPFTNKTLVELQILGGQEQEMYITNDPQCKKGGTWQPFSSEQEWHLGETNIKISVYVKFRSFNVISSCFSDTIIHDDIPPQLDWEQHPKSESNESQANFILKATDNLSGLSSYYCGDLENHNECEANVTLNDLNEGSHRFTYFAKDKAGNTSDPIDYQWLVDLTPPQMEWLQRPHPLASTNQALFEFTANDEYTTELNFECRLNSPITTPCTSPYVLTTVPEGPSTLIITTSDRSGNMSQLSYQWVVDTNPPIVKIVDHPGAYTNQILSHFKFLATDAHPQQVFECSLDGTPFQTCSASSSFSMTNGKHHIIVRTTDLAGHTSLPTSHEWIVDLLAPTVQLTSTPDKKTRQREALFSFTGTDQTSGIQNFICRMDGVAIPCSSPIRYGYLSEGNHLFHVQAQDFAGNLSNPQSYEWEIDISPPTIRIVEAPETYTNQSTSTFKFLATDKNVLQTFECSLDGETFQSCPSSLHLSPSEGKHNLTVRTTDLVGNISLPVSHEWTVDFTAPLMQIVSTPDKITNQRGATFSFKAEDQASGVESIHCVINGNPSICTSPHDYTNLPQGVHTFELYAQDKAGNTSNPLTYEWTVDLTPPSVHITSGPKQWSNSIEAFIEFEGSSPVGSISHYECALGNEAFQTCQSPHKISGLAESPYEFQVIAIDDVGLTSAVASHSWVVDLTLPSSIGMKFPAPMT